MTIPTTKINSHTDAIVRSFDMHIDTTKKIESLLKIITTQDEHIKLITVKLLKIEKTLARFQMTEGNDEWVSN